MEQLSGVDPQSFSILMYPGERWETCRQGHSTRVLLSLCQLRSLEVDAEASLNILQLIIDVNLWTEFLSKWKWLSKALCTIKFVWVIRTLLFVSEAKVSSTLRDFFHC